jgi:hypothetical protein
VSSTTSVTQLAEVTAMEDSCCACLAIEMTRGLWWIPCGRPEAPFRLICTHEVAAGRMNASLRFEHA